MVLRAFRLAEGKRILTAHHIGNIILSILFFAIKTIPALCTQIFAVDKDQCGLDRREHEIMVFLGVLIIWKNRKAVNWLHYLSNVFLYAKLANIFLFLRADPLIGTIYVVLLVVHAVLFPEPVYRGVEAITYFQGPDFHNEIEKNKRITWLVQFYTTWSNECKHVSPVFSALSERFHLPNLRFAKLDIGRYPAEAERFRINIHPASKQLPTENIILEYGLNTLHQTCKRNMKKHEQLLVEEEAKTKAESADKKMD